MASLDLPGISNDASEGFIQVSATSPKMVEVAVGDKIRINETTSLFNGQVGTIEEIDKPIPGKGKRADIQPMTWYLIRMDDQTQFPEFESGDTEQGKVWFREDKIVSV